MQIKMDYIFGTLKIIKKLLTRYEKIYVYTFYKSTLHFINHKKLFVL